MLEPRLLISTSNEAESKLFLWAFDQPRNVGNLPFEIHHPFQHKDELFYLMGNEPWGGWCSNQGLAGHRRGLIYKEYPPMWQAISDGQRILGMQWHKREIDGEWLDVSDILAYDGSFQTIAANLPLQYCMAVLGEKLWTYGFVSQRDCIRQSDKSYPAFSLRKGRKVLHQGVERGCLAGLDNKLLLGGVGSYVLVPPHGQPKTVYWNETVAHAAELARNAVQDHGYIRYDDELAERAVYRAFDELGIKGDDPDIDYVLHKEGRVRAAAQLQDDIYFSVGKRLYSNQGELVWTFRWPITGLTRIEEELNEELSGKMSVRRGKRSQVALRIAA